MSRPLVAVVGRPNVGKSTFFNKVCGKRISIVQDEPGVTRDRIYGDAEWCGCYFSLVDTGGIDFIEKGEIQTNIISQAKIAADLASVILFFVDGKEGLTTADYEVASFLRKSSKPIILVVNKLDNYEVENSYEFYSLNCGDPYPISAEHGKGVGDVLDAIVEKLKVNGESGEETSAIKIAVVGKPNAGKSSLTNRILNDDRMLVTSIAGTTRDAIDTPFTFNGEDFVIIDTAGMRKKAVIEEGSVESYSVLRSIDAIRRSEVCLLVIDVTQGISDQDLKIASFIDSEGKPLVVVLNKWDLIEKDHRTMNEFNKKLEKEFDFMSYIKPVYISAKSGQRVADVLPLVKKVYENASRKIPMGVLNEIVGDAVAATPPPSKGGKRLKIIYVVQAMTCPPKFLFFCQNPELIVPSYSKYLENKLRVAFDFEGTPIKLLFRNKNDKDE